MKKTSSSSLQFRLALLTKAKLKAGMWIDYAEKHIPTLRKMEMKEADELIEDIQTQVEFNQQKVLQLVALLNKQLSN